jgi:hypothetical protein
MRKLLALSAICGLFLVGCDSGTTPKKPDEKKPAAGTPAPKADAKPEAKPEAKKS